MKKWMQIFGPLVMILLAIIPFMVLYEGISMNIPSLPDFEAPDWFIPVGFVNIALIVLVSLLIGWSANKE
ncbi:hypothetical protein [Oceanobacillus locisalsi]|uniref:DUF3311 domain-containing protein n=1 Tax=Oceanobacillus locisalsi TaxID=546107 RepID=A0ABW3NJX9_9BACI